MEPKKVKNNIYSAKVKDVYNEESGTYVTQGIKGNKQGKFERSIQGKGSGSNGSYLMFDEKVTYTFLELYIYDLEKKISVDIRDFLKETYNGRRLTKKFLARVQTNMPNKIKVQSVNNVWEIVDYNSLQISILT